MPTIDMDATANDAALLGALPEGLRMIPLDQLHPHPKNPRRDVGDVSELADSIREHGIRQPLLAVPDPGDPDRYRLVIGHRRHAGAGVAGLTEVPVIVDPTLTEADQLELMLVENVQRANLTPVEEADGYQGLLDLGMTVEDAATKTGRSESTVRRRLKLVTLPDDAREKVHAGQATLDDVAALPDAAEDPEAFEQLAARLGTSDFRWALQQHERDKRAAVVNAADRAALADMFAERGITVYESGDAALAAGLERSIYMTGPRDSDWQRGPYAVAGAGWGWVYERAAHPGGSLYRPADEGDAIAPSDDVDPQEAARLREEAEQERREHEAAQAAERRQREAVNAFATTSAEVRRRFLLDAIAGRKGTTTGAKADSALVWFLARLVHINPVLATGLWFDPSENEDMHGWLGIDLDAIAAAAAEQEIDEYDAIDRETLKVITATKDARRLLAVVASAVEPISAWKWTDETARKQLIDPWYVLLSKLGYAPSSIELAATTGIFPEPNTDGGEE